MEYQEEESTQTEENTVFTTEENIEEVLQEKKTKNADNRKKTALLLIVGYGILALATVTLFILHFSQPKNVKTIPVQTNGESQTTIITINTDSIMEHYVLVQLLRDDLEQETEKYQKELETKSIAFQTKVNNYQINLQNNVLTQTQMQNTERQLMQEKETLEALSARYTKILMDKENSVQNEIMDSLKNATKRINDAGFQADYIFAINAGSAVLYSNKLYDITDEVIKELNETYKKSTK